MILAILLGPQAAFLVMASVLTVQALFFADGGLLALGCNLFNLGFFPCFVAYPLVYRRIAGRQPTPRRILLGSLAASILGLELGALAVVLQTTLSGIAELPFRGFLLLMLPVHLAIGIIEGLATAGVVTFVWKSRPEVLSPATAPGPLTFSHPGRLLAALLALTALTGGALSWFASSHPDGLEWSVFRASGREDPADPEKGPLVALLGRVQEKTAFLPDYGFKDPHPGPTRVEGNTADPESWPAVSAGTSLAGIVGALITLALVGLIGVVLRRYHRNG